MIKEYTITNFISMIRVDIYRKGVDLLFESDSKRVILKIDVPPSYKEIKKLKDEDTWYGTFGMGDINIRRIDKNLEIYYSPIDGLYEYYTISFEAEKSLMVLLKEYERN